MKKCCFTLLLLLAAVSSWAIGDGDKWGGSGSSAIITRNAYQCPITVQYQGAYVVINAGASKIVYTEKRGFNNLGIRVFRTINDGGLGDLRKTEGDYVRFANDSYKDVVAVNACVVGSKLYLAIVRKLDSGAHKLVIGYLDSIIDADDRIIKKPNFIVCTDSLIHSHGMIKSIGLSFDPMNQKLYCSYAPDCEDLTILYADVLATGELVNGGSLSGSIKEKSLGWCTSAIAVQDNISTLVVMVTGHNGQKQNMFSVKYKDQKYDTVNYTDQAQKEIDSTKRGMHIVNGGFGTIIGIIERESESEAALYKLNLKSMHWSFWKTDTFAWHLEDEEQNTLFVETVKNGRDVRGALCYTYSSIGGSSQACVHWVDTNIGEYHYKEESQGFWAPLLPIEGEEKFKDMPIVGVIDMNVPQSEEANSKSYATFKVEQSSTIVMTTKWNFSCSAGAIATIGGGFGRETWHGVAKKECWDTKYYNTPKNDGIFIVYAVPYFRLGLYEVQNHLGADPENMVIPFYKRTDYRVKSVDTPKNDNWLKWHNGKRHFQSLDDYNGLRLFDNYKIQREKGFDITAGNSQNVYFSESNEDKYTKSYSIETKTKISLGGVFNIKNSLSFNSSCTNSTSLSKTMGIIVDGGKRNEFGGVLELISYTKNKGIPFWIPEQYYENNKNLNNNNKFINSWFLSYQKKDGNPNLKGLK